MIFPAILALAQLVPAILPLFDSDDDSIANKAARGVSEVAKMVTGTSTDGDALAAIKADPALMIEYQKAMTNKAVSMYQSETNRLVAINETIRAEVASTDKYVSRMRPTMGYALIASWSGTMFAIVYTIIVSPGDAPAVITAVASLGMMWSVALSVLGLYVYKRSEDKKPDKADKGMGVLSSIAQRIAGVKTPQ